VIMTRRKQMNDSPGDYEVVGVSQGKRAGGIVSVRLKPEEMDLLTTLSEVGGRTLSDTLRLGLRCIGDRPTLATGTSAVEPAARTSGSVSDIVFTTNGDTWARSNSLT
jgi:hypothetical protein